MKLPVFILGFALTAADAAQVGRRVRAGQPHECPWSSQIIELRDDVKGRSCEMVHYINRFKPATLK